MRSIALEERRSERAASEAASASARAAAASPTLDFDWKAHARAHALACAARNSPSLLGPAEAADDDDEFEDAPPPPLPAAPAAAEERAEVADALVRSGADVWLPSEESPSLCVRARVPSPADAVGESAEEHGGAPPGTRLVRVHDRVVQFTRAPCKRASRAARPHEPSAAARGVCRNLIHEREAELKRSGRTRLGADDTARLRVAGGASGGGKGPAIRAQVEQEQAKINHIVGLKSRNVDTYNQEASFLLWGQAAPQCYDRLAESALRANAGNSSVTKRKDTQGAAFQTTRINCKTLAQCAATQCTQVALAMALAEAELRAEGVLLCNPAATNAVDPSVFAEGISPAARDDEFHDDEDPDDLVVVASTAQLLYNARPTKLGAESIRSAAKKLAKRELSTEAISERVASSNYMLTALCRSVAGGYEIDSVWASIVLIVYLCCDPRGRPLLRETGLTDLDVQTACAFEAYGRGEITRRARLRAAQQEEERRAARRAAKRRRVGDAGAAGDDAGDAAASASPAASAASAGAVGEGADAAGESADVDPLTGLPIEDDDASIVNDDEVESDEPALDDPGALDARVADQKVLATKRKRASKGYANASTADAHGICAWWFKALRSPDRSVLETLITATKTNAREAALSTLETQTEGSSVAANRVIQSVAVSNATRSAQALVPFVERKPADVPRWVAFSTRTFGGAPDAAAADGAAGAFAPADAPGGAERACVALGLAAVPELARRSVLHACARPPPAVRPPAAAGVGVLWSVAMQELASKSSDDPFHPPGVLERHGLLARMRQASDGARGVFKAQFAGRASLAAAALERHVADNALRALPSAAGGLTRSFVALKFTCVVHEHTRRCAAQLAEEARALWARARGVSTEGRETPKLTAQLVGTHAEPTKRLEPYCTPAPRLAVGLRLNELLRRFMQARTRKNEPCKVLLGQHSSAEASRDVPPICDAEPLPLATLTDVHVRVAAADAGGREVPEADPLPHTHVRATAALHVCLDGAVRAPEAMASLAEPADASAPAADAASTWHRRALLFAGSSQASYVGDVGAAVSASAANANINSSKKVSTADVNTLCLLSIWDVYAGGLVNVARSFAGTPYTGTYGPLLDHGLTSPGLAGHFYRSDRRGHGSMTLSTDVADRIAGMLAHCHHVEAGDKKYALTPVQTRGIPHGFIPGVHALLADAQSAVDRVAREQGRESAETVNGLFALPFSAFTQALRPDVESTADSTLRHCFREPREISTATGRSYMPDATSEAEAIVIEPLFRRPCQSCVGDNPFATSYEHVDSVWNAVNALALIARECGGVDRLHQLITHWTDRPFMVVHWNHEEFEAGPALRSSPLWAADACILIFGVLYPHRHAIAAPVVPECYARALPFLAKALRSGHEWRDGGRMWECGPQSEEWAKLHEEAAGLWYRFSSRPPNLCPWKVAVAPMLSLILRHEGSHDLTLEQIAEFRNALNTLCSKGAWLAYSEDGVEPPAAPNPAHGCATMNDVRRPTLDPVFVAQGEMLEIEPRGCLVGLKPFQLRQLYALMLGAHLPRVDAVQVVRNEGGLLLRESSNSTILQQSGAKRSDKAVAPTQTESDQAAYGTRRAKVYGAALQTSAWDANALLVAPLCCAVDAPMPREWRQAGEFGDPSWLRQHLEKTAQELRQVHPDEARSRRKLEAATTSRLTECALAAQRAP